MNGGVAIERTIREQLIFEAEEEYQIFSSKLLPNVKNILGVRLPKLRKIAKQIAKEDGKCYLNESFQKESENDYFEEIMLQGMVIGYLDLDIEDILTYIAAFLPKIDNWSICDSFCSGLKITKKKRKEVWNFLIPYLSSCQEFELRFVIVMFLNYYMEEEYIDRVIQLLNSVHHEGYYVKMAIAWAVSVAFVKFPDKTFPFLKDNQLDDFTYHKALQKIRESYKIDNKTKNMTYRMKRK